MNGEKKPNETERASFPLHYLCFIWVLFSHSSRLSVKSWNPSHLSVLFLCPLCSLSILTKVREGKDRTLCVKLKEKNTKNKEDLVALSSLCCVFLLSHSRSRLHFISL